VISPSAPARRAGSRRGHRDRRRRRRSLPGAKRSTRRSSTAGGSAASASSGAGRALPDSWRCQATCPAFPRSRGARARRSSTYNPVERRPYRCAGRRQAPCTARHALHPSRMRRALAGGAVVEHAHGAAAAQQLGRHVRTDEAGAAGDEDGRQADLLPDPTAVTPPAAAERAARQRLWATQPPPTACSSSGSLSLRYDPTRAARLEESTVYAVTSPACPALASQPAPLRRRVGPLSHLFKDWSAVAAGQAARLQDVAVRLFAAGLTTQAAVAESERRSLAPESVATGSCPPICHPSPGRRATESS